MRPNFDQGISWTSSPESCRVNTIALWITSALSPLLKDKRVWGYRSLQTHCAALRTHEGCSRLNTHGAGPETDPAPAELQPGRSVDSNIGGKLLPASPACHTPSNNHRLVDMRPPLATHAGKRPTRKPHAAARIASVNLRASGARQCWTIRCLPAGGMPAGEAAGRGHRLPAGDGVGRGGRRRARGQQLGSK